MAGIALDGWMYGCDGVIFPCAQCRFEAYGKRNGDAYQGIAASHLE